MSSKYGEVPDNNLFLNTPSIIYFWEPHAKSSSMKITPTIMINIRNPKYGQIPDNNISFNTQVLYILETSSKIKFNEDYHNHHDHNQEPQ